MINDFYSDITDTERYYNEDKMKQYLSDVRFSNSQLEVIRYGLECGVDVSIYAHPQINANIMMQILASLQVPHNYCLRYVKNDNSVTVCTFYSRVKSKQELLDTFVKEHSTNEYTILDID